MVLGAYDNCLLLGAYDSCLLLGAYDSCLLLGAYDSCLLLVRYVKRLVLESECHLLLATVSAHERCILVERVRYKSTEKIQDPAGIRTHLLNTSQMLLPLIRLRPLGNATYVACLPLLCQGSEWLNGKSV